MSAFATKHPANAKSGREWARELNAYRNPDNRRAALEIAATALPLAGLWVLMWLTLDFHITLTLLLAVPTGLFLVRMFMIQHDCGHGAFFASRRGNDWAGRIIGVLTLTPYGFWKHAHAIHHAGSGCLERRGVGDVDTLTVDEYRRLPRLRRLGYRLYRNPLFMFGLGPTYLFLLQHRLPVGQMRKGWRPWASVMGTNLMLATLAVTAALILGIGNALLLWLPVFFVGATVGIWMFFVQHQFEHTSWDHETDWEWHDAALHSSSFYDLPQPLRWLTANIGIHHVHHLASRIPFYRLGAVLRDYPELRNLNRVTLLQSLASVRLALWDSSARRLVSFRDAARLA